MAVKGFKSKNDLKKSVTNINTNMKELEKQIGQLSKAIQLMMNGDSKNGPMWNGVRAKSFYNKAIANIRNDIADYKNAYEALKSYANFYEYYKDK